MAECRKPENADGLKASIFKALRSVELTIHGNEKRARVGGMRVAHVSPTRAATSNVFPSVPTRCDKRSGHNPSLSPRSGNHSAARHQSPLTTTNAKWSHLPQFQENGSCKSEPTVPRAFIEACTKGDIESVRELLKEKPDLISYASILCQKYSGLHYAAKGGHHDVVRLLLNSGADVNLRTASGYTALHLAAICKHTKVIEVLLKEYRADCNIVDLSGRTFDYYAGSLMSDVWRTKRDGDGDKSCFQLRCFSCNADESYTGVTEVPQQQAQTHTSAGFVNSN